jgi:imidazolonepropionase
LATLIIRHLRQLIACAGPAPRTGSAQRHAPIVTDAAIAADGELIVFVGRDADLPGDLLNRADVEQIDGRGLSAVPGFVDAHTHAIFAGDRRDELRRRLAGATYAEIAAAGGGIVSTVAATRRASEDELVASTRGRLDEMLACGTTSAEVKSGYGLDVESELKMLRALRQLGSSHAIEIASTFMGAHEIPVEYRNHRDGYVQLLIDRMIPAVAAEGLAEWCDVFCETGVFNPDESRSILLAGMKHGLKPRIHADELGPSGGSIVAADVSARSADHMIFVPDEGIASMARAGVVATLLPIATLYLKIGRFAPARALIDAGVPVALATDVNPGGGFSPSMPFAMTLGCFAMGLTFEEALVAATINAAYSVDRAGVVGSLEPGKQMDVVLVAGDAIDLIRVGVPSISRVIKRGRLVQGSFETQAQAAGGGWGAIV